MLPLAVFITLVAAFNVELASSRKISLSNGRIIGGESTTIESHPYQVSIQRGSHFCGGSIISENYVLTAAHCSSSNLSIRAGATFHDKGGSIHRVVKFTAHEKYGPYKHDHDIAVIEVDPPFEFDETKSPIELFEAGEEAKAGTAAVVTGWGCTKSGCWSLPAQLQNVTVPIVSKNICNKLYEGRLPDGQICAALLDLGGKDSCQGDSGGPLTIEGKLAGVVSWGRGCALPDYPGVYTEVAYYRDWIREKTSV